VILRSPLLTEADLVRLVLEGSDAHREVLAARPNIGEKVSAELVRTENETVLVTLLHNATARISPATFDRLAELSKRMEPLREPMAYRKDMPPEAATKLCAIVSQTLKEFILKNYPIEPRRLEAAMAEAAGAVTEPREASSSPEENARKLIDKLYAAGQIKAGFLIRVLQQGNIELFELGLARLLEMSAEEVRQILYERGPKFVALVCRAVGIDRCVFLTVFNLTRKARSQRPILTADNITEVDAVFVKFTKTAALGVIQSRYGL
jgi:uncharacterized protein (DUF2336 family)